MVAKRDMYFLSKNYISADCTINVTSADTLKARIYDQKYNLQWISSGETAETGYDTYIEILFYEGSNTIERTYDTIVLQNINLKKFKLQNYSGSYSDISGASFTVNADSSVRIKLASPVTGTKIKLLMESTIVANEEKKVAEFWVCLETYRVQLPRTERSREDFAKAGFSRLGNGAGTKWFEYNKWGKTYEFEFLTDAQLAELESIYRTHAVFTFYENYTRDIDLIKLVFWVGEFSGGDNPKVSIQLNTLEMQLMEK